MNPIPQDSLSVQALQEILERVHPDSIAYTSHFAALFISEHGILPPKQLACPFCPPEEKHLIELNHIFHSLNHHKPHNLLYATKTQSQS